MRPPVLEIGYEFEQSQPIIKNLDAATELIPSSMQAWKMRLKLRGRGNVYINSRFNINKLFYNDITFELDEIIAFLFGDLFIIYKKADVASTKTANPGDQYSWSDFNICFAAGYNY